MTRLSVLAASASGLALLLSTPALAQSADVQVEQAAAVGDIVVTAQRRSESIRDVPFAVTAMNTETLTAISAGGAATPRASTSAAWAMWTSTSRPRSRCRW